MSEREITFTDEGTNAYMRMVEEMVREHFDALDTSGEWSQRDAVESDLKKHMDLEELEAGLKQADTFLEGFWHIGEAANNLVFMMIVSDARERTMHALERVQQFRAAWG